MSFASTETVLKRLAERDLLDMLIVVAAKYGVSREQVASRQQTRVVAAARAQMWAELYDNTERRYTLQDIGEMFGGRKHSTVLFGIRQHRARKAARP